MTVAAFVVAAGLGTLARRWLADTAPRPLDLPLGTLVANLSGALALGLLAGWTGAGRTVAAVAGLGGFTTFSTVAAELVDRRDRPVLAAAYAGATVVGGVAVAWAGLRLA